MPDLYGNTPSDVPSILQHITVFQSNYKFSEPCKLSLTIWKKKNDVLRKGQRNSPPVPTFLELSNEERARLPFLILSEHFSLLTLKICQSIKTGKFCEIKNNPSLWLWNYNLYFAYGQGQMVERWKKLPTKLSGDRAFLKHNHSCPSLLLVVFANGLTL